MDLPEKDRYTYEDYRQLPEGAPYELINGHLVMSPALSPHHQIIQSNLFFVLSRFVRERDEGQVLTAPLDVRLSEETVLQPDIVFVDRSSLDIIGEQDLDGPPDLVAEIVSPSTAHRDLTEKKRLYEEHDVREYWTVDPDQEVVEVFRNTENGFVQHTRVVEHGSVSSAVLEDFSVDLEDLF